MAEGFDAPWSLGGESLVAWLPRPKRIDLPAGLRSMPGPAVLVAARHETSPVGRYISLGIGVPARLGIRPGICFVAMAIDSNDRRVAGIANWGLPGELADLRWSAADDQIRLEWRDRDIVVVGASRGAPLPFVLPMRALQRRTDGPVVVPVRSWGRVRFARVAVEVPADDDLAWLQGGHGAIRMSGLRLRINPARVPAGLLGSLRAPLRAAEPGLGYRPSAFVPLGSAPTPRRYSDDSPRAYGSVG